MDASLFRRLFEMLLCSAIAFAFVGMALWLASARVSSWYLAHCFQPDAGFKCAASAVFINYWWLTALALMPLFAVGLFVFMGRRDPH